MFLFQFCLRLQSTECGIFQCIYRRILHFGYVDILSMMFSCRSDSKPLSFSRVSFCIFSLNYNLLSTFSWSYLNDDCRVIGRTFIKITYKMVQNNIPIYNWTFNLKYFLRCQSVSFAFIAAKVQRRDLYFCFFDTLNFNNELSLDDNNLFLGEYIYIRLKRKWTF